MNISVINTCNYFIGDASSIWSKWTPKSNIKMVGCCRGNRNMIHATRWGWGGCFGAMSERGWGVGGGGAGGVGGWGGVALR